MPHTPRPSAFARAMGWLLLIAGLAIAAGGAWLAMLGGSWYYMAAGLAWLGTGGLLLRGHRAALWIFTAYFLGTLAWGIWEAGLDWWPLAARLGVPFLAGALLLAPWVRNGMRRPPLTQASMHLRTGDASALETPEELRAARPMRAAKDPGSIALATSLALFAAVAVASWFYDPHRIRGALPELARTGPPPAVHDPLPNGEWHAYGRTPFGQRYSPLDQIHAGNISQLQVAWQYRTGDVRGQPGDPEETTFQVTPLKIGNRLFLCTPHQSVIALNATTGAELWRYDPKIQGQLALQHLTCRGLSYRPAHAVQGIAPAPEPLASAPAPDAAAAVSAAPPIAGQPVAAQSASATRADCAAKLYMPTADGRILALDPESGAICTNFGNGTGQIDLWANMPNVKPGSYYSTSPVVATQQLLIVGGTVLDNVSTQEASGVIRAFDADTGALVWNWDSGNPDNTAPLAPGQQYTPNSPNSWSIASADERLGLVYIPMGNQPPDQWGGHRSEAAERFSSSVVALDIATGQVRWVYQTVRHDLWDYDVPSQPSLVDLTVNGETVPALVQPTKQGDLFVLDRRTGEPILPVHEVPAPQGAAEGDYTALTQPKSALSFDPPPLAERDMWGATLFDQLACRIAFRKLRYEGQYTPPSEGGSLVYPGNFGVFNWGGIAVDPERQVAFTTPTYLAFTSQLVRRKDATTHYVQNNGAPQGSLPALNENLGAPFAVKLAPFTSPLGLPCQEPPWGYVAAADLTTGKVVWMHRNGTVRDRAPVPLPFRMGVPNLGGPVMTAGGVAFLSGTLDYYVRGYDVRNGDEIWRSRLPAGGQATPMTYLGDDGRQYLLVVAGGHGSLGTKAGDHVIAYALPGS
ncbi:membrane-bound PQQ-dependent dehydrogenase, glucose/quinate/shikimate family [Acidovorax sp.]|uniref:membrane-bound PQQ-dependent dehydrogenase, glucose/quinate/shikimate family n=1 Tax=Acidovorax sp. TaxID=1872122 RepID=UPI00391BA6B4